MRKKESVRNRRKDAEGAAPTSECRPCGYGDCFSLLITAGTHIQIQHHRDQKKYKASYTAETAVRRIESQLNRYLAKADFLNYRKTYRRIIADNRTE